MAEDNAGREFLKSGHCPRGGRRLAQCTARLFSLCPRHKDIFFIPPAFLSWRARACRTSLFRIYAYIYTGATVSARLSRVIFFFRGSLCLFCVFGRFLLCAILRKSVCWTMCILPVGWFDSLDSRSMFLQLCLLRCRSLFSLSAWFLVVLCFSA